MKCLLENPYVNSILNFETSEGRGKIISKIWKFGDITFIGQGKMSAGGPIKFTLKCACKLYSYEIWFSSNDAGLVVTKWIRNEN